MTPRLTMVASALAWALAVAPPAAAAQPPASPAEHDAGDRAPFLNRYAGRYELTERFHLDVTRVGDALYVQATGQPPTQLRPRSRTEFVVVGSGLRLLFELDPVTGEVDHLVFEQNGFGRRAEKLEAGAVAVIPDPIDLPADVLDRYVGTYEEQPGFAITVRREGARLTAAVTGLDAEPLVARSETDFDYQRSAGSMTFVVGDDGRTEALVLHQGGADLEMPRVAH